jgi:hypothetical protein
VSMRFVAALVLGLLATVVVQAPASADQADLDVERALTALTRDPVFLAPRTIARIDVAQVRRELAGTRIVVLVEPFIPDEPDRKDHDKRVIEPVREWSKATARPVVLVTGLMVTMPSVERTFFPEAPDYRDALERYDVTRPVLRAVRYLRDGAAPYEPWRPKLVPPDPAQLKDVIATLRKQQMYIPRGWFGVRRDLIEKNLETPIRYKVVMLRPLVGDAEPDLLPGLAAAFPGELILVVRGRWISAVGIPPEHVAAARAALVKYGPDHMLVYGFDQTSAVYNFLDRVGELRATPEPRPDSGGIDSRGIIARWAPWTFAAVAFLFGGVALMVWTRRTVRGRRSAAEAILTGRADVMARLARLSADLHDLDPGTDAEAARRLADAAERYATARDLLDRADTPEEMDAVLDTLAEGEAYADDVRSRLALPVRGS